MIPHTCIWLSHDLYTSTCIRLRVEKGKQQLKPSKRNRNRMSALPLQVSSWWQSVLPCPEQKRPRSALEISYISYQLWVGLLGLFVYRSTGYWSTCAIVSLSAADILHHPLTSCIVPPCINLPIQLLLSWMSYMYNILICGHLCLTVQLDYCNYMLHFMMYFTASHWVILCI